MVASHTFTNSEASGKKLLQRSAGLALVLHAAALHSIGPHTKPPDLFKECSKSNLVQSTYRRAYTCVQVIIITLTDNAALAYCAAITGQP